MLSLVDTMNYFFYVDLVVFILFSLFLVHSQKPLLTVSFSSGDISLMNNYDDLSPTPIRTGLKGVWVSSH